MFPRQKPVTKTLTRSLSVETKRAYQLVTADLWQTFLQMKDQEAIRFGNLGKFTKKEHKQKSALDKKTYVYYTLNFKMFSKLKQALAQQIIKKYRLK